MKQGTGMLASSYSFQRKKNQCPICSTKKVIKETKSKLFWTTRYLRVHVNFLIADNTLFLTTHCA